MATSSSEATPPEKEKKDSKDFVEHLRTIHFTLLISCIALMVIILSPSPMAVREANGQLSEIVEVTTSPVWNDSWLQKAATEALQAHPNPACNTSPGSFEIDTASGQRWRYAFGPPNWGVYIQFAVDMKFKPGVTDEPIYQLRRPLTLSAFREMWDSDPAVFCPTKVADEEWVVSFLEGTIKYRGDH